MTKLNNPDTALCLVPVPESKHSDITSYYSLWFGTSLLCRGVSAWYRAEAMVLWYLPPSVPNSLSPAGRCPEDSCWVKGRWQADSCKDTCTLCQWQMDGVPAHPRPRASAAPSPPPLTCPLSRLRLPCLRLGRDPKLWPRLPRWSQPSSLALFLHHTPLCFTAAAGGFLLSEHNLPFLASTGFAPRMPFPLCLPRWALVPPGAKETLSVVSCDAPPPTPCTTLLS